MFSSFLRSFSRFSKFKNISKIFVYSMTGLISNVDRDEFFVKEGFNESVSGSKFKRSKMSDPATFVTSLIKENNVVIFSKKTCPFCKMAKDVFDKIKKPYKAVELDEMDDTTTKNIQDYLWDLTGARTVPRVFVKGECIGGGSDVKSMYEKGELLALF